jgi:hypothetical protein
MMGELSSFYGLYMEEDFLVLRVCLFWFVG